ncbi:hypothetical protein AGMMS4956_21160 [Bacteroidia bacterium]|nr:hypothetical protein AGMMS4956_21160 [Bacteroidia bacterium]
MKYPVYISFEAKMDIEELYDYIAYKIFAPMTAVRYRMGLLDAIDGLSFYGASITISPNRNIQRLYGFGTRVTYYKKMAIIYNFDGNVIYVRRIIASAMIQ